MSQEVYDFCKRNKATVTMGFEPGTTDMFIIRVKTQKGAFYNRIVTESDLSFLSMYPGIYINKVLDEAQKQLDNFFRRGE